MKNITPIGKAVLLHICCGVCMGWPVQKLRDEGYTVFGYFFNPNIYPKEEYEKRIESANKMAKHLEMEIVEGEYDHSKWLNFVKGFESEKEGGKRCGKCFFYRLDSTYKFARENGFYKIASTLSVSPHKNSKIINEIGFSIAGANFLPYHFGEENGFQKTKQMAKNNSLYFQKYCGCEFSIR